MDPHVQAKRDRMHPTLTVAERNTLRQYGELRHFKAGDVLYAEGQRHIPMYVILEGAVEVERSGINGAYIMGKHCVGGFTGEVSTLAGRAAIATLRAVEDGVAIAIGEESLRTLVVAEAQLSETIMRAFILRRLSFVDDKEGGITVIGAQHTPETLRIREFLIRNGQPFAYFDIHEHPEALGLLERFELAPDRLPVLINLKGEVHVNPSNRLVADFVGLSPDRLHGGMYDVAIVGAGPAGLAAAVYAASEGLKTIVLDSTAPGGQAGRSSKIENYFGFPTGVSGQDLAGRGITQARKFGAEVAVPVEVTLMDCAQPRAFRMRLDNNEVIEARSVIIASGARYRKPALSNLERYEGKGVYYGASFMEANLCARREVIVVGGGNSAGQAAVFLANHAAHVHIIVRGAGLAATMSNYLIQRIAAHPRITLHAYTEIVGLAGEDGLEQVTWRTNKTQIEELAISHVFLFLGAAPNTQWLGDCVALDSHGFVVTGPAAKGEGWPLERDPFLMETSLPGIFAVGDVRSASVKRVATAVGEGSAAIQALHVYLSEA